MLDLEPLYRLVSLLPFECLQAGFMQQALVALILLAPMAATMGVQQRGLPPIQKRPLPDHGTGRFF